MGEALWRSPVRILNFDTGLGTGSVALFYTNSLGPFRIVVEGIDITGFGVEPTHITFRAAAGPGSPASSFYYDSQSTGEGLGVYSSWRGELALDPGDVLEVLVTYLSGSTSLTVGIAAWGYITPVGPF